MVYGLRSFGALARIRPPIDQGVPASPRRAQSRVIPCARPPTSGHPNPTEDECRVSKNSDITGNPILPVCRALRRAMAYPRRLLTGGGIKRGY